MLDKVVDIVYARVTMAKYDSMRKLERNKMLREYTLAHPELSLKEIGKAFGISTSRVSRIISSVPETH
ncbi:MAG TPA: sigma factor-like helix-turn-helix DNA-binding protein [Dehalococcoidia bacterium]|nr:sigma factor-like helix-turn-helix DNA-binding protein [Dehalococcoidia bacterium]